MEGLKNMVANAMGDDDNWPKVPGSAEFQPLSSYEPVTPKTVASIAVAGHNVSMHVSQSLDMWAGDIKDSMTPSEVAMLIRLISPPPPMGASEQPNDLPEAFWEAVKAGQKITAIKELRAASTLNLKGAKAIVDAIMNDSPGGPKPEPDDSELRCDFDCDHCHAGDEDESEDESDSDKDESDKDKDKPEDADKDQDKDDTGDDSEESEPDPRDEDGDQDGDGDEFDPDDYGPDEYDSDSDNGEPGELGGDQEVSAAEAEAAEEAGSGADTATAEALTALANKAHANGKDYSEDDIKEALKTLGISF